MLFATLRGLETDSQQTTVRQFDDGVRARRRGGSDERPAVAAVIASVEARSRGVGVQAAGSPYGCLKRSASAEPAVALPAL